MKGLAISGAAALAALAPAWRACAQTAAQIQQAAAEAIAELDLQTAFPANIDRDAGWSLDLPYINFSTWMLWAGLAIALACVLYAFRDELPVLAGLGRSRKWQQGQNAGGSGQVDAARQSGLAPDQLAAEGRHVEAMHALLLAAIAEIRLRLGEPFADSLTSREILRSARLPDEGRASLRDLITRVELSYFGAYPAAQPDYAACRSSFEALMRALGGGARA
ncbi:MULTISPECIES: hypothetical protein [Rhodomicrobium]|uniref:hypothetical protein n=1 Tax=Rhodomicrobium TaxID=1068 RepID=UPI000B4AC494|nr:MULTISPECIES: hypothetical protein [Rhodomicrobium]